MITLIQNCMNVEDNLAEMFVNMKKTNMREQNTIMEVYTTGIQNDIHVNM